MEDGRASSKVAEFRKILDEHTMGWVGGILVDVQSANAVLTVLEGLAPKNKELFTMFPANVMVDIAWKLIAKV